MKVDTTKDFQGMLKKRSISKSLKLFNDLNLRDMDNFIIRNIHIIFKDMGTKQLVVKCLEPIMILFFHVWTIKSNI